MKKEILELYHYTAVLKGRVLSEQQSFQVYQQEIFGILTSWERPECPYFVCENASKLSGAIRFMGKEIDFSERQNLQKAGIHLISQQCSLIENQSLAINFCVYRPEPFHVPFITDYQEIENQTGRILREWGFKLRPGMPVREMDEVDRRSVELIRSVENGGRIIVMDRMFQNTPIRDHERLKSVIREAVERKGISCVVISNNLEVLSDLCDRIMVVRQGINQGVFLREDGFPRGWMMQLLTGLPRSQDTDFISSAKTQNAVQLLLPPRKTCACQMRIRQGAFIGFIHGGRDQDDYERILKSLQPWHAKGEEICLKETVFHRIRNIPQAIRKGIFFMAEIDSDEYFFDNMDLRKNLAFYRLDKWRNRLGFLTARIPETFFRESRFRQANPEMDGGSAMWELDAVQHIRLSFERAWLAKPKVILWKIPLSGILPESREILISCIRETCSRGVGLVAFGPVIPELYPLYDEIWLYTGAEYRHYERNGSSNQKIPERTELLQMVSHSRTSERGIG